VFFLHRTSIGHRLVKRTWTAVDTQVEEQANYKGRKDLGALQTTASIFWQNCRGGILNHANFYETIAEKVQIYRDEIVELSRHNVHLRKGG
jgi:dimethylaniline monooxygenase (N-oxide forming)